MKTTLLALFILCTGAAFGQVGVSVLSSQPQVIEPSAIPSMQICMPWHLSLSRWRHLPMLREKFRCGSSVLLSEPAPPGMWRAPTASKSRLRKAEFVLENKAHGFPPRPPGPSSSGIAGGPPHFRSACPRRRVTIILVQNASCLASIRPLASDQSIA
jgi:hypothetical protein